MKPFRLLILTPSALPTVTGNAMTAERWRRSLVGMGLDVRVLGTEGLDAGGLKREIDRFKPDLLSIRCSGPFPKGTRQAGAAPGSAPGQDEEGARRHDRHCERGGDLV